MATDKSTVRTLLRQRRAALLPDARAERSAALLQHLTSDEHWAAAGSLAAFVGIDGEPDTLPLLTAALAAGKQVWLPRVLDARAGLSHLVPVDSLSALVPGPFGLLQPQPHARQVPAIDASLALDLVLVPGLGFDRTGGRIGHGPGHYDRLLAPIREQDPPWRLGVCFAEFLDPLGEESLPVQDHDVPMHAVVTDQGITVCAPRMIHTIEPASTARAKCRACGQKIDKGALRFGERTANPYGEGLATFWFHLVCAAMQRPEPFAALLHERPALAFEGRDALAQRAAQGVTHRRLSRWTQVSRAPSGRARCRHCQALIDKGAWRIALSIWQEGRLEAMGFIHAACARAYFACDDLDVLRARVTHGAPDLDAAAQAEIVAVLAAASPAADTDA